MAMAFEFLGISPIPAPASRPSTPSKAEVAYRAGELVMDVLARGQRPSDLITRESLENAIAAVAASGGSTNAVLHLLAVAREAGVELSIDDFDRIATARRCSATSSRAAASSPRTCTTPAAAPCSPTACSEAGLLHEDAPTVTGRTIGEHAAAAEEQPGQEVIRPLEDPLKPTGGLAILRGNLAPDGCVVKLSGHDAHPPQRPGARVRGRGGRDGRGHRRRARTPATSW